MMQQSAWAPLLDGELAEQAHTAIHEIAVALRSFVGSLPEKGFPKTSSDLNLAFGHAGLALVFRYLENLGFWPEHTGSSHDQLVATVSGICEVPLTPSLFNGYVGVGWVTELLAGGYSPGEADDPNNELDGEILQALRDLPESVAPHDLVLGVLGTGIYAAERLAHPAGREILRELIGRLDHTAESTPNGICWQTTPRQTPAADRVRFPQGYYYLGVSHGTAGVLSVLGTAWALGIGRGVVERLLEGGVRWLLAHHLPVGSAPGGFPLVIAPGARPRPAPLAWCHGNPGIAAALLCTARSVGEAAWERAALELALQAAQQPVSEGDRDPCLCHGAAGRGHIFNRLYQATGAEELREAARAWLSQALRARESGKGLGGYTSTQLSMAELAGGAYAGAAAAPGFLMGAAGVAAVLAAAIGKSEPWWDRCLLISPAGPDAQRPETGSSRPKSSSAATI